ncbi:MAG: M23 family metallopeptidase [Myxococcota bacterium]
MSTWVVLVGWAGCEQDEARPVPPEQIRAQIPLGTRFGLPMDRTRISTRIGFDHDPVDGTGFAGDATCLDYAGRNFPHCYDEHDGTDLILVGGFDAMDAGSTPVRAAYDGWVIEVVDGNYDRCHIDGGSVSCDGYPIEPNYVEVEHPDGLVSRYFHLQQWSAVVEIGDQVPCGTPLGRVGSSGNSSMPHLHFEVQRDGVSVDPFAGPYSQPESLWEDQGMDAGLPEDGCVTPL